ncbi:hypothetical protein V0U79_08555 [Hyphobacterium sp. HN65]|uniref:Secreted protein n=1 Tax=Hyphobacterium lacteum TaxID=3116575 RepID=A0ABU7LR70_9PROT|nr:hypothetical protein [Hyphobacterium sp. HN65]MEE2526415.1 hypothetical protein [Hyphobacterium sp. HN65]
MRHSLMLAPVLLASVSTLAFSGAAVALSDEADTSAADTRADTAMTEAGNPVPASDPVVIDKPDLPADTVETTAVSPEKDEIVPSADMAASGMGDKPHSEG